jgi:adenine phosphoribosyltransferase
MDLTQFIRNVPDFPVPGIQFKDVTTLLQRPEALKFVVDTWSERYADKDVQAIIGAESRGFIFGAPLAYAMGLPFVPIRKPGKLPWETESCSYELEYGSSTLEIHTDAFNSGDRIVIVDDLLATGGTLKAACELCKRLKANIYELAVVIELPPLNGREKLAGYDVHSMIQFNVS